MKWGEWGIPQKTTWWMFIHKKSHLLCKCLCTHADLPLSARVYVLLCYVRCFVEGAHVLWFRGRPASQSHPSGSQPPQPHYGHIRWRPTPPHPPWHKTRDMLPLQRAVTMPPGVSVDDPSQAVGKSPFPLPQWHHKWGCPPWCTMDRSAY